VSQCGGGVRRAAAVLVRLPDTEILRSIKTLEKINNKPAAEFWKEVDAKKP
jgi:hypothetical protein